MQTLLLILVALLPALCAAVCWFAPAVREDKKRDHFVFVSLLVEFVLVIWLCTMGDARVTLFEMTESLPVILASDGLARLFAILMSGMWLMSGAFSFRYMSHEGSQRRYYTFYLLTLSALMGLCFAGTLATMYLFFELMTLLSVAMVLHSLTKEAVAAGMKYLLYSIAGAMMGLLGVFYFTKHAITPVFTAGGNLDLSVASSQSGMMLAILFVTIVGFGTKAGMFPMHGWLPTAHPIAPAPASAVLSGVITKAGVICIIRFLYYVVGADLVRGTWVQTALIILSLLTVFMGSMMAFKTTGLKKRLAYSSVSQVSYVLFGLFMLNEVAFRGAMLHVYFHSLMKNLLFFAAGSIIFKTGLTDVRDLTGIGKKMPVTLWCFTIAGVSLVGVPPLCGFFSKWQLAQGALSSGVAVFGWLGPVVLLVSALLTGAYLLPVSINGFFPGHEGHGHGHEEAAVESCEVPACMYIPMIVLAVLIVVLGLCPSLVENAIAAVAALVL